jgi:hypothetical protein
MKNIDAVRGFEREIKFAAAGYATRGGVSLSNCVIEVVENDWQGAVSDAFAPFLPQADASSHCRAERPGRTPAL